MRILIKKYGLGFAVILLVIAGLSMWFCSGPPHPPVSKGAKDFFIDEETGEESVGSANAIPPLLGKNGKPTVVRLVKYSCDGGKTSSNLFYAKYSTEVQAALKALPERGPEADVKRSQLLGKGELVRRPAAGSPWVSSLSAEGMAVSTFPDCNGKPAAPVYP